ncbi:BZ3501_MvSof-1269-A2-R1_Chr12-3g03547 [Microbotryum saponariae]|nr:BZ3501_MvSof-1269-A2-R1_Chr12-2g03532 [Microbotryum saponariae]SDA02332.1 BZ3501_MvSof-1269-A2-R1_Chr12-3g03547 [Microbotryum saponariae]
MSSPQQRLAQVSGAISGSYPRGLLKDEVVIITGSDHRSSTTEVPRLHSAHSPQASPSLEAPSLTACVFSLQAAQGIGKACALTFAREGAKVVVSDLDESRSTAHISAATTAPLKKATDHHPITPSTEKAQTVVDEIKASGGDAIAVGGDVTADDSPKRLIKATIDAYGKINHIVNNAGFTFDKMLHTMTNDAFELILKVHLSAPFRIVREAAPYLRTKDPKVIATNRSIVNISSIAGLHGNVGQTNYATAKSGILGFTKTVAKEWGAFNVRCNAVAFGYILSRLTQAKELGETIEVAGQKIALGIPTGGKKQEGPVPGIPLGRPGTAQEAANGVLFLVSPLASYVTGHTLEVTAGNGI